MGDRLRRIITTSNLVRLVVSILLAFIVWGFVQWETDPERSRTVFAIQVEAENLEPTLQLTSQLPTVNVTFHGPRSVIQGVDTADIRATVDLSDVTEPGVSEHKILDTAPDGVRETDVTPANVEVVVDLIVAEEWPVAVTPSQPSPLNLTSIELSTETVTLTGTRSQMDKVEEVLVNLDLSGRTDTFGVDLPAIPVDSGGVQVSGITVTPDTIHVDVFFEVQSRLVPVNVICQCVTESGPQLIIPDNASSIPSEVRIVGPASVIENIEAVETDAVDIAALEASGWIFGVQLNVTALAPDVVLEVQSVDVWVEVPPATVEFSDVQITVANLGPGLRAVLATTTASFTVTGETDTLEGLETTPVVFVDVAGRSAGSSTEEVQVVVPPGLAYNDLDPAEIQVTIIEVEPNVSQSSTTTVEQ